MQGITTKSGAAITQSWPATHHPAAGSASFRQWTASSGEPELEAEPAEQGPALVGLRRAEQAAAEVYSAPFQSAARIVRASLLSWSRCSALLSGQEWPHTARRHWPERCAPARASGYSEVSGIHIRNLCPGPRSCSNNNRGRDA